MQSMPLGPLNESNLQAPGALVSTMLGTCVWPAMQDASWLINGFVRGAVNVIIRSAI